MLVCVGGLLCGNNAPYAQRLYPKGRLSPTQKVLPVRPKGSTHWDAKFVTPLQVRFQLVDARLGLRQPATTTRTVAGLSAARNKAPTINWPLKPHWGKFPGKQQVDAVIFDLDGTLLNSLFAWEHAARNFVRAEGYDMTETMEEQLVKMSLLDGAQLIKDTYHLPYTLEEIVAGTLRPIKAHYDRDIQALPGVPELLARLKMQGVKMAVATASHKEFAQAALTRLGLADYFDFIITCDEVGVGKSSPKVYEVAAQRLGVSKERTLVAEDALHALQTAHQAGFKTAGIEEEHSAHQRTQKQAVSDYYVISYQGIHTLFK